MLLDIAVILLAAKVAAELCERVRVPAVVGEIIVGILIGQSLLGWIPSDSEPVAALAELGVLLLLVQVGMEMDLAELGRVGRASMSVATIGVAVPFLIGGLVGLAFGESGNTALFVGAALTATSVGITARVFGDLKALATTEARIVLGAAVADDVLGLIMLTVVVKIVTGGDVTALSILGTIFAAVGFLVVATLIGVLIVPMAFRHIERFTKSSATIVVLAFAFVLVFSWAAEWAKLAPIIGAFVAGLAIGRSDQHARVERDFGSTANLLIPVFFVQIGLDADVAAMARPAVIGLAAALLIAGIVGKLVAAFGAFAMRVDKVLIGIGMIPRGEVGIIFASIGLAEGVLGDNQYAALLIVVLVTTLMTPPLLRWRVAKLRTELASNADEPDGDWDVAVVGDRIVLRGRPAPVFTIPLALKVAELAPNATPDSTVIDWFGERSNVPLSWDPAYTASLVSVLRHGDARSLRFLDVTGVLERALPEVGEALARRRADPGELDPTRILQLPTVQRVAQHADRTTLLTALVADVCATGNATCAPDLAKRLDPDVADDIVAAVLGAILLDGAIGSPDALSESNVLQLAEHFGGKDIVDAAYQLAAARLDDDWRTDDLTEIRDRVLGALAHPELLNGAATLVGARRREAMAALGPLSDPARLRLDKASPSFLVSHDPVELARQVTLLGTLPRRGVVRIVVDDLPEAGTWRIDVSCRDRPGLLARLADALAEAQLSVMSASLATWPDGGVIDSFVVHGRTRPDPGQLTERMERRLRGRISLASLDDLFVTFEDDVYPWHTQVTVSGGDRPGRLAAIASALDSAKVDVHAASLMSYDGPDGDGASETSTGEFRNRFQVTDRHGRKLNDGGRRAVLRAFGLSD